MADNNQVTFYHNLIGAEITLTLEDGQWYYTIFDDDKVALLEMWHGIPDEVMSHVKAVEQEMYFDGH